jgi:hypothetical protein
LNGDIQAFDVERLEEDLGCLFSVFRRIERRFRLIAQIVENCYGIRRIGTHKEEVVIFRLSPQILEDGLLPVSFHVIPVVYHSMTDRVVYSISWGFRVRKGFVSDKEIKVFYTTLRREVTRLRGYSGRS